MDDRVKNVEKQIQELKSRWPAHSVPPAMVQQLDELEEELEQLRNRRRPEDDTPEKSSQAMRNGEGRETGLPGVLV